MDPLVKDKVEELTLKNTRVVSDRFQLNLVCLKPGSDQKLTAAPVSTPGVGVCGVPSWEEQLRSPGNPGSGAITVYGGLPG